MLSLFSSKSGKLFWVICFLCVGLLIGAKPSSQKTSAPKSPGTSKKKVKEAIKRCAREASPGLFGKFRELDCWITYLRTSQPKGYLLDKKIYRRMRSLYHKLRKAPVNKLLPSYWKMLYTLGTRMYPRQNRWAVNASVPVYEMNGHHHAFTFWLKESFERKMGTLFHIDSHPDTSAVPDPKQVLQAAANLKANRNVKKSWHTIAHKIYYCGMPVTAAVMTGVHSNVVWGRNQDIEEPTFLLRPFFFGLTRPGIPEISKEKGLSKRDAADLRDNLKDLKKKPRRLRLYYDPQRDRSKTPVKRNIYWTHLNAEQRPISKKFMLVKPFVFSSINLDLPVDENGKGKGAENFKKLLKAMPKGKFTLDVDLDYFASVDTTYEIKREQGSDPSLDFKPKVFKDVRELIDDRLDDFEDLLIALKKKGRTPSVITISDSTFLWFALDRIATAQSEYTPIEHAAYLRYRFRQLLRNVYGEDVSDGNPDDIQTLVDDMDDNDSVREDTQKKPKKPPANKASTKPKSNSKKP